MDYQFNIPSRAEILSVVMNHVYELNLLKLEFGTYNLLEFLGVDGELNATIDGVDIQVQNFCDILNTQFNIYYSAQYEHGGLFRIEAQREMLKVDHKMKLLRSFQNMAQHCLREYRIWLNVYFPNENSRDKVVRDHMNMMMIYQSYYA